MFEALATIPAEELSLRHARCRSLLAELAPEASGLLVFARTAVYYLSGTLGMDAQPDFVKLAEAYGAKGFRISKTTDLRRVLQEALDTPGTVIVDVLVEREENVYPMVPAGASLTDMLLV